MLCDLLKAMQIWSPGRHIPQEMAFLTCREEGGGNTPALTKEQSTESLQRVLDGNERLMLVSSSQLLV